MPIYEYMCDGCSKVFEVFQKVSDPAPTQHDCGSTQVHRVLSNTSFVLKGTGWYATDYAKKDSGAEHGGKGHKMDGGDKAEGSEAAASTSKDDASGKKDGGGKASSSPSPGKPSGGGGAAAA